MTRARRQSQQRRLRRNEGVQIPLGHSETLGGFSLQSGASLGRHSHYSHSRIPIKAIQIGKGDIKLSLCVHGTILYVENPKQSTKNLLVLIN